jgi:endonuclease/exonuclease/phosphatase family metal-dependent hydrolase
VRLTLASLNLHCGLSRRGDPYSVKAAVAALAADVVVVQENWCRSGGTSIAAQAAADCGYPEFAALDMVTDTPMVDLEIVGNPPDESGAWGLAIMSRRPWRRLTSAELGPAVPGDAVGPRLAQVAEFPMDGDVLLRVVNLHLTHRLLHGPAQLRHLIAELKGGGARPTVLAGDFNMCRPTIYLAWPYRPVARGRSWPAHRPVAQLDHILAGPGVRRSGQAAGRGVPRSGQASGPGGWRSGLASGPGVWVSGPMIGPAVGSDHRPVLVTFDQSR